MPRTASSMWRGMAAPQSVPRTETVSAPRRLPQELVIQCIHPTETCDPAPFLRSPLVAARRISLAQPIRLALFLLRMNIPGLLVTTRLGQFVLVYIVRSRCTPETLSNHGKKPNRENPPVSVSVFAARKTSILENTIETASTGIWPPRLVFQPTRNQSLKRFGCETASTGMQA